MQCIFGMAVFFNEFIPNFSDVTAQLYDMIAPTFNWDRNTWSADYEKIFKKSEVSYV